MTSILQYLKAQYLFANDDRVNCICDFTELATSILFKKMFCWLKNGKLISFTPIELINISIF